MYVRFPLLVPGLAAIASAASAQAPVLVTSIPAADAIATAPAAVVMTFDQAVMPESASYELLMVGMPGMRMAQPMRMAVASSSVDADGTALTATLAKALPAGKYSLTFHVRNRAGEEATGSVGFGVR